MNKKLVVALTAPVLIFGCGQDKTGDDILSQIHKNNTQEIVSVIEKQAKAIPITFKSEGSISVEVTDINKVYDIPYTGLDLKISTKSGANESNFDKYQSFSDIELNGSVTGDEIKGKLSGTASLKIVDNSLFANLSKGQAESNVLPVAMTVPTEISEKWFEVSFADLEEQINKAIPAEARGGKDIKIVDFIKLMSYTKAKEELNLIASIIKDGPILKVITEDPKAAAKVSEDGANYILDVELDKERVEKIVNQYLDFVFGAIPLPAQEKEVKAVKDQLKAGLEAVKLTGTLTVDKSDLDDFLFEGVLSINGQDVNISFDRREDNFIVSATSKDGKGFVFSVKGDKLELWVENRNDFEKSRDVIAKGIVTEDKGTIDIIDPKSKEVLTTISYEKLEMGKVLVVIDVPAQKIKVSLEANMAKNMLSGGLTGSVEINSINIAKFDIQSLIKKVSSIKVDKPAAESIEKVDLEQAAMMLMMGAGGMMGGGAPMMPSGEMPEGVEYIEEEMPEELLNPTDEMVEELEAEQE